LDGAPQNRRPLQLQQASLTSADLRARLNDPPGLPARTADPARRPKTGNLSLELVLVLLYHAKEREGLVWSRSDDRSDGIFFGG